MLQSLHSDGNKAVISRPPVLVLAMEENCVGTDPTPCGKHTHTANLGCYVDVLLSVVLLVDCGKTGLELQENGKAISPRHIQSGAIYTYCGSLGAPMT